MLSFIFVVVSKIVEAQTVFFRIHDLAQFRLKAAALCRVQQTFKDRALHSLAIIDALFGDLPQSFSARGIFGIHIIGD